MEGIRIHPEGIAPTAIAIGATQEFGLDLEAGETYLLSGNVSDTAANGYGNVQFINGAGGSTIGTGIAWNFRSGPLFFTAPAAAVGQPKTRVKVQAVTTAHVLSLHRVSIEA